MYVRIYIHIYTHEYLPTRTAGFSFLELLDFWILVLGASKVSRLWLIDGSFDGMPWKHHNFGGSFWPAW